MDIIAMGHNAQMMANAYQAPASMVYVLNAAI
jgi:hypothetical protein